jgi:hypothetical protein
MVSQYKENGQAEITLIFLDSCQSSSSFRLHSPQASFGPILQDSQSRSPSPLDRNGEGIIFETKHPRSFQANYSPSQYLSTSSLAPFHPFRTSKDFQTTRFCLTNGLTRNSITNLLKLHSDSPGLTLRSYREMKRYLQMSRTFVLATEVVTHHLSF